MNAADRAIIGVLALAVGIAVFFAVRRKRHSGCCGNCGACTPDACCMKKGADKSRKL